MGGMAVLEWPLCTPPGYIRHVIPIATSARHSAWCISWGEAQRQSIYSDPLYLDGYYDVITGQPKTGLAAARMAALLTYRSRDSFESRFGRKIQIGTSRTLLTPPDSPSTPASDALAAHNDGHRSSLPQASSHIMNNTTYRPSTPSTNPPHIFTAQSYLRYQGEKFTARFDANCYIHLSRKMDTHDVSRGRDDIDALALVPPRALVISIQTDGLFTPSEQHELAEHIPDAYLVTIPSPDGHDGFLLEFEQINRHVLEFLRERLPELYLHEDVIPEEAARGEFDVKKTSMFGEAEADADITQW